MWNLARPDISQVREHLDLIFPEIVNPPVLTPDQKDALLALYTQYENGSGRPSVAWVKGALDEAAEKAILDAYKQVSDKGKLSELRSSLRLAVSQCPYCGFGEVRDLDHHLQKQQYKCFSIYPLNLVPACSKCNGHKPRRSSGNPQRHHLHAYLEDVSEFRFFVAEIELTSKAMAVTFRVEQPPGMSAELFARLKRHLVDFRLNDRYPAQVNNFLSNQKVGLSTSHKAGGLEAVRSFLQSSAKANETSFGKNDWRTAVFEALSKSDPFCDGGFYAALGYTEGL